MGLPYAAAGLALIVAAQAVSTGTYTTPLRHPASRVVTICLARDGSVTGAPATCSYDKLHQRLSDCHCPSGTLAADTKICWPGEHPAPMNAAANQARYDAASNGRLMSARFEGRSFCQHVRDDGLPHWFSPVEGTTAIRK
jgi:hypothetical protein